MLNSLLNAPWALGLFAGATIFLGLPIAKIRTLSPKVKAFLNAVSTGILIFLLVEITGHVIEQIEEMVETWATGSGGSAWVVGQYAGLFVAGFSLGLLGLIFFEERFLGSAKDETVDPGVRAKNLSLLIAVGLGLHNLSEGLAIGQGYAGGAVSLAWMLAIGFALHNATEGFGVAAPMSGHPVSWKFLALCGIIGGGPTFIGAAIGSWWVNKSVEIFCLALASGTILYIIGELLHIGRQIKGEKLVSIGLLIGFFIAMGTDLSLSAAHEVAVVHGPRHGGYFGDANDLYHYEIVRTTENEVALYVNDHYNQPMDTRTVSARWILNPGEAGTLTGFFTPTAGGSRLTAMLPASRTKGPLHITVSVLKGDQWADMEFYLPE